MLVNVNRGETGYEEGGGAAQAGGEDSPRDEEGLEGKWVAILATTKQ